MNKTASSWLRHLPHAGIPVLLALVLSGRHLRVSLAGGLLDPDSYMRLVRLEASLSAGAPLHVVARDSSGSGTVLHWSHLLDGLLCLLALPLRPWMDWHQALHVVGLAFGPACLAALGLALVWAIAPFSRPGWRWSAPVAAALSPAIALYGLVGVVHHHVPVVIVAVLAAGIAARIVRGHTDTYLPVWLGVCAGLGLWLTPESVPLSVLSFGALWVAWATAPPPSTLARSITVTGASFFAVALTAWLLDPPMAGYASAEIDRISILSVALSLAIAVSGGAILVIDRSTSRPLYRLTFSVLAGGFAAGVWASWFPQLLPGSAPLMDAPTWHAFFDDIAEMRPIVSAPEIIQHLLTGGLAALLLLLVAIRARSPVLGYAALAAVMLVAVGQAHLRFAAYPEAVGAALLPIAIGYAHARWAREASWAVSAPLARVGVIAAFLLLPMIAGLSAASRSAQAAPTAEPPRCSIAQVQGILASLGGQTVLANVNHTPELLYRTSVRTVGSLYHRNPDAFLRLRSAWRSGPSEELPAAVAATGASVLLYCEPPIRSALVADLPTDTLLDRLGRGEVPHWLVPIATGHANGPNLYWIVRR